MISRSFLKTTRGVVAAHFVSVAFSIGMLSSAIRAPADAESVRSEGAGMPQSPVLAGWRLETLRGLPAAVLELGLAASACAIRAGVVADPPTLTLIDYSKPSTEARLWVVDLRRRALLYEELVSHGQGSGDTVATRFSNTPETHQSSLGLFVTGESYVGQNGYSLRLDGLEPGVNDRARERAIVIHGAPYVSQAFVDSTGRLGRSWGCPAVRPGAARGLIDRIKGGSLVFSYGPDARWLETSGFLGNCSIAEHR